MNQSNGRQYGLPVYRARQLYYFCLQYEEMKAKAESMMSISAVASDGQPRGTKISDPTQSDAIRVSPLMDKIRLIENTVKDAGKDIAPALLIGVTKSGATYDYLVRRKILYCSRNTYYARRRAFYALLSERLERDERE